MTRHNRHTDLKNHQLRTRVLPVARAGRKFTYEVAALFTAILSLSLVAAMHMLFQ